IIRDLDAKLAFLVIPKDYARIILRRGSRICASGHRLRPDYPINLEETSACEPSELLERGLWGLGEVDPQDEIERRRPVAPIRPLAEEVWADLEVPRLFGVDTLH